MSNLVQVVLRSKKDVQTRKIEEMYLLGQHYKHHTDKQNSE